MQLQTPFWTTCLQHWSETGRSRLLYCYPGWNVPRIVDESNPEKLVIGCVEELYRIHTPVGSSSSVSRMKRRCEGMNESPGYYAGTENFLVGNGARTIV